MGRKSSQSWPFLWGSSSHVCLIMDAIFICE
jgi:hypothetical protein